ncbi:MAG: hypothetical protein JRH20_00765 [Deltaproteobacteria bacterium]|nr:hypothetical protein [Deltaproteobacteria bacterium]
MGVLALVLAIIAMLFSVLPTFGVAQMLGIALGILALFFGAVARDRSKRAGRGGMLATAAVVVGIIAIIVSGLVFATCQVVTQEMGQKLGDSKSR